MVLEIRLKNFFSIKEEVVLDLRAANINTKQTKNLEYNIFEYKKETLLKTVAIYGANASGKTNIIKAIRFCCRMIFESHLHNENTIFNFQSFKLDQRSSAEPSTFFIRYVMNNVEFEYSFSLSATKILTESLYYYPKGRLAKIFMRDEKASAIKREKYSFGSAINKPNDVSINTSDKTLFISRASQMDRELAKDIFNYFNERFLLQYVGLSVSHVIRLFKENRDLILEGLQKADSDIVKIDLSTEVVSTKTLTATFSEEDNKSSVEDGQELALKIRTYHKFAPNIPFDFETEESAGTKKLFHILLRIIDVIKNNKVLLIDEIDTHLHSDIVEYIINLFHAGSGAQLIFSTHNTNLLDLKKMRKDQLYFVNKKETGATELYSLFDFKDFRESMDAEKGYLQGRFDAIPFVDDSISSLKSLIDG